MEIPEETIKRLSIYFMRGYARSAIKNGIVDIHDKTDEEVREEIYNSFKKSYRKEGIENFKLTMDHTGDILKEARNAFRSNKKEISCLFYATWLEHWLNNQIQAMCIRKGLDQKDIKKIFHANFDAKTTWIRKILELKPINKVHLSRMKIISEIRNSFVHYKWKIMDIDEEEWDKEKQEKEEILSDIEKTIRYLRDLDNRQFFSGRKNLFQKTTLPLPKKIKIL